MSGTSIAAACLCPVAALCPNSVRKVCLAKTLIHVKASCFLLYGCWMIKRPKLTTESQCSMNVPLPVRLVKVCFFHVDEKKFLVSVLCFLMPFVLQFRYWMAKRTKVIQWSTNAPWTFLGVPVSWGSLVMSSSSSSSLDTALVRIDYYCWCMVLLVN